jgi:hypothetical protein
MRENQKLSRRAVVGGLAIGSTLSAASGAAVLNSPDAELIALGRQLDSIPAALDRASEYDEAMVLLEQIDILSNAIVTTPAKTLQGLYVKARATAWALQDDPDPMKESSINNRVAASIVRDLLEFGNT